MIKRLFIIIFIFSLTLGIVLFFSEKNFKSKEKRGPRIGVSIYPIYFFASKINGDKNEIILILPPGSDPHHFDLTPEIVNKVKDIDYLLYTGFEIDFWVNKLTNLNPKLTLVKVTDNLNLIQQGSFKDPHFWFSLRENKKLAENILNFFVEIDKKNKEFYEKNYQELIVKLEKIDEETKNELKNLKNKKLILQHNFLNYFARDYEFEIVGVLEKEEGELPPQEIKILIDKIKKNNLKVIFGEKFKTEGKIENFAKDLNLKVYYLDPLENWGGDFFERYEENVKIIKKALENND